MSSVLSGSSSSTTSNGERSTISSASRFRSPPTASRSAGRRLGVPAAERLGGAPIPQHLCAVAAGRLPRRERRPRTRAARARPGRRRGAPRRRASRAAATAHLGLAVGEQELPDRRRALGRADELTHQADAAVDPDRARRWAGPRPRSGGAASSCRCRWRRRAPNGRPRGPGRSPPRTGSTRRAAGRRRRSAPGSPSLQDTGLAGRFAVRASPGLGWSRRWEGQTWRYGCAARRAWCSLTLPCRPTVDSTGVCAHPRGRSSPPARCGRRSPPSPACCWSRSSPRPPTLPSTRSCPTASAPRGPCAGWPTSCSCSGSTTPG